MTAPGNGADEWVGAERLRNFHLIRSIKITHHWQSTLSDLLKNQAKVAFTIMKSPADKQIKKRQRKDKRLTFIVTLFGGMVLFTLVLLITHLISQAMPLAMRPDVVNVASASLSPEQIKQGQAVLASGDLMEGQPLMTRSDECRVKMLALNGTKTGFEPFHDYIRPCDHETRVVSETGQHFIADVSSSGQVRIVEVQSLALPTAEPQFNAGEPRTIGAGLISFALPQDIWDGRIRWQIELGEQWIVAVVHTPSQIFVRWVNRRNPVKITDHHYSSDASVLPLPGSGITLVYENGVLGQYPLKGAPEEKFTREPVSWWHSLPKDRTVLMASPEGKLTRWVLQNTDGKMRYYPTWTTTLPEKQLPADVTAHATTNGLALLTKQQQVLLMNRVTGEVVSRFRNATPQSHISWYGQRLYLWSDSGVSVEKVNWLTGITTWSSLFSPQQYEGYQEDGTIWQTTSGSDYQETKYSLVPLLIGSLKASVLALIIAIPVAVGAAVYSAYFSRAALRHWLKPALELLEAVPSVLIGFVAAIWLAPMAERVLFSFAFFLVVVPLILFAAAFVQNRLARKLPHVLRQGTELVVLPLMVFCLGYVSMQWAPEWIFSLAGVDGFEAMSASSETPVGKTTIVVALALGVAISPTIYSLAEDAISGVPDYLKHASFALGATRLQTLQYVVLQMAMPGILAAIMLGFGRAFGETMIVLMVTGNTPVSDWSLLEGLRALTANLAIELPETDVQGAHYQILFLTACILFGFTFIVNTLAELLRQKLRVNARHD